MWSLRFISKTRLARDIWEFRFTRPEGFDYIPGQYAAFVFDVPLHDTRGQSRVMSLTSHPTDDYLAFVTRISEPPSPFKTHLFHLERGDSLLVDSALGDLVLPRSSSVPLVFVAGGIGLASYVSMLRDVELSNENRTVHLLYALRAHEEKLFGEMLGSFPFASSEMFVSPKRLSADTIITTTKNEADALYYLSGTERFVEGLRSDLIALGLNDTQIVFDYFTGYEK
jgi:ferredoxin-NADP reductase